MVFLARFPIEMAIYSFSGGDGPQPRFCHGRATAKAPLAPPSRPADPRAEAKVLGAPVPRSRGIQQAIGDMGYMGYTMIGDISICRGYKYICTYIQ